MSKVTVSPSVNPDSKPKGEELRSVHTHQVPFVTGIGQLKNTLDANSVPGAKMYWRNDGVLVYYKGAKFIIPHANVVSAAFVAND